MATNKPQPPIPAQSLTPAQRSQIAAAMQEVLSRSILDVLLNASPADLRAPQQDYEAQKGNEESPSGWLHAPSVLQLLSLADKRLRRLARWMGLKSDRVDYVHVHVIGNSKLLHIRPCADDDRTGLEVSRYQDNSGCWINLYDLLAPLKLTLDKGYKTRFNVFYVPQESPLWPGLVIDLGDPKERRLKKSNKKKQAPEA